MPLQGVVAAHESLEQDLAGVSTNGDYVLDQLGEIVTREIHLNTCVEAINQYCSEYDCICVICVNIDHAEKLHAIIPESTIVHSQLTDLDRRSNMLDWEEGRVRVMVSVEILLEGLRPPKASSDCFHPADFECCALSPGCGPSVADTPMQRPWLFIRFN